MRAYPHPPRKYIDISKLITDSWRLVWRHKFLWFFGLFAGGSASFGGWSGNFSTGGDSQQNNNSGRTDRTAQEFSNWINAHLTLIFIMVAAVIAIILLLWLWSIICRGAVIGSVRDTRQGGSISFGSAFARGRESFGRLFLFDLFLFFLSLCLIIIIAASVLFLIFLAMVAGKVGWALLSLLGLWSLTFLIFGLAYLACCTFWFVPWVFLGIIVNFAARSVILEGNRPIAAFRRIWRIVMDNLSQTLLVFLVSLGLSIGASIAITIGVGLTAIPAGIAWFFAYSADWNLASIVIASSLTLIPLVAIILAAAVMNTYFTTFWTITYDKLAGHESSDERFPRQSATSSPLQPPHLPTGK